MYVIVSGLRVRLRLIVKVLLNDMLVVCMWVGKCFVKKVNFIVVVL